MLLLVFLIMCATAQQKANFVAVGGAGSQAPFNTMAYSMDAINWNPLGNPVFNNAAWDVVYAPVIDTWLAVGGTSNTVAYSGDGINWVGVGTPVSTNGNGVFWFDGLFIAVGGGGTNTMARSIDGINWIPMGNTVFSGQGQAVYHSRKQKRWVAIGCCTNMLAWSSDGLTWNGLGNILFSGAAGKLLFVDQLDYWVAAGSGRNFNKQTFATSPDGKNWTLAPPSVYNNVAYDILYVNNRFVSCGGFNGNTTATSPDGITWTATRSPFGGNFAACLGLSYHAPLNRYFATGQNTSTGMIAYSSDFVDWTVLPEQIFSVSGWNVAARTTINTLSNSGTYADSIVTQSTLIDGNANIQGDLGVVNSLTLAPRSQVVVAQNLVVTGNTNIANTATLTANQIKLANSASLSLQLSDPCLQPGETVTRTYPLATFTNLQGAQPSATVSKNFDNGHCTQATPTTTYTGTTLSVTVQLRSHCNSAGCPSSALSTAALAGIIVGAVLALAVVAVVVGVILHKKKRAGAFNKMQQKLNQEQPEYQELRSFAPPPPSNDTTTDNSAFNARYGNK